MEPLRNRVDKFVERCHEAGLKATHQRTEIYRVLAATTAHPDAETIFRRVRGRVPAISFDTVYRTLRTLDEKGLIVRVDTPLERSRFDANTEPHHHFVCARCGAVRDLRLDGLDGLSRAAAVEDIGVARSVHVEVRGLCHACAKGKISGRSTKK
jgi:Fur family transcriptional regulator, peroxide stress response regulator